MYADNELIFLSIFSMLGEYHNGIYKQHHATKSQIIWPFFVRCYTGKIINIYLGIGPGLTRKFLCTEYYIHESIDLFEKCYAIFDGFNFSLWDFGRPPIAKFTPQIGI